MATIPKSRKPSCASASSSIAPGAADGGQGPRRSLAILEGRPDGFDSERAAALGYLADVLADSSATARRSRSTASNGR